MAARIKLGELLVRAGVLDDFKLKAALAEQQRWGGRLGRILVEMNFVSEDLLVKALSKQLGVPRARLEQLDVPPDIVGRIDPQFASTHALCPERYLPEKKTLLVAMVDPTNVGAIDELRFKTGLRIETSLAGELEITQAIDTLFYGRAEQDRRFDISAVERASGPTLMLEQDGLKQTPAPQLNYSPNARDFAQSQQQQQQPSYAPPATIQPSLPPFAPQPFSAAAREITPMNPPPTRVEKTPRTTPPPLPTQRGPSTAALEMAVALDAAQKKQLKATRVLLELLIEKGVFSRDEYMALVNRR
jgi:hypothetical protein